MLETNAARLPSLALRMAETYIKRTMTTVGFWLAVSLPFLYLPLLTTGMERESVVSAFFVLLVIHAASILLGHRHGRE